MKQVTAGIHHITALAGDPQRNVDFYAGILGLRLVKKTINFDAPGVYHLYFGNESGSPGTAMTFFPYKNIRPGRRGAGQVGSTTFALPPGSLGFWEERLKSFGIQGIRTRRFGEDFLAFDDPDGLGLELVERPNDPVSHWAPGGIPEDKALKGFGGARLLSLNPQATQDVLMEGLGLELLEEAGSTARFRASGDRGQVIDLDLNPGPAGLEGGGVVHHIAWRARDHEDQERWRTHLADRGLEATPIIDRQYFRSVYFREPGGILFEIATDGPGFAVDEPDQLGTGLMLPSWLEIQRSRIEGLLPPLKAPALEGPRK